MNRALAVCAVLFAAPAARGDMGPMIPLMKNARATHQIETLEEHPDHVFVLYREGIQYNAAESSWDNFREAEYVELVPGQPLTLNPAGYPKGDPPPTDRERRRERVLFVVAPRETARRYKTALDLADDWNAPRASRKWFDWRTAVSVGADDEVTLTYRVQRNQASGELEIVKTSANPFRRWAVTCLFVSVTGLFLFAAITLGGFWLVRRVARCAARLWLWEPPPRPQ